MTQIEVNGSEIDTLYLFHLDLPREAVARFTQQAGTGEWPLKYGLGARDLREAFVDVIDLRDLGEMPLSRFLNEAHGVTAAALGDKLALINRLKGHVIALPARAFNGVSQTLSVASPLRFIGKFEEIHGKRAARTPRGKGPDPRRLDTALPKGSPARSTRMMRLALIGLAAFVVVVLAVLLP